jgi:hypothetical protein
MSTEIGTGVITTEHEQRGGQLIEVATSRQAQEVQAMIVVAKKFPRDEDEAVRRITTACRRTRLAEASMYKYARGGQDITGPSIRLAEALAQAWGNIDYGLIELSQEHGESQVMAYAWDMETNTRSSKVFTVKHLRSTKQGTYALTDPRDIYETVANQGARRVRSAILAVIPGDVQDLAIEQCTKTLTEGHSEPLVDRVRKMFLAFAEYGVTKEMIEARCQRSSESFTEQNLLDLRKIYMSLKDKMSAAEDWFVFTPPTTQDPSESSTDAPTESKTERKVREMKGRKKAADADNTTKTASPPEGGAAAEPATENKVEPPAAAVSPAPTPAAREAARGLPFYEDYSEQLLSCKDDVACRNVCSAMILPQKDMLSPEVYAEFLRMRDLMIAKLSRAAK